MASAIEIRFGRDTDAVALGAYGTKLMALHHQWDRERFIATDADTEAGYTRWLRSQLTKPAVAILVAEQGAAVVGYSYATTEGYNYMALRGPAGVIQDIFVDPDRRQQGIGRRLLDATVAELRRRGMKQIVLSTAYRNETAQRLFAAAGFRPTMVEMTLDGQAASAGPNEPIDNTNPANPGSSTMLSTDRDTR